MFLSSDCVQLGIFQHILAVFQETIENSKADYASKITTFLMAELHFATDMGIEVTTLAYSFNLREALSKKTATFKSAHSPLCYQN
ncbi:hypothetical protein [Streptococcus ferus]|uniref:hypothetical protein n=1 Tax=Streptococcus ferus TaxID=1345 RepID=UPI0035A10BED